MSLQRNLNEIRTKGITYLKNEFKKNESKKIIKKLDRITFKLKSKKSENIKNNSQFIPNPFRHDPYFLKFIYNKKVDAILKNLIEDSYVLLDSTAINRKKTISLRLKEDSGTSWHTDTAYLKNKKVKKGLMYLVIYMFENFTKNTSSTLYVPGSFKKNLKPIRNFNYKSNILEGAPGTIVVMDASMWHKSGKASTISRWSMFNLYGPWFHKPYFDFYNMMNKKKLKIPKKIKKLLHFNSTPPLNDSIRLTIKTKL